MFASSPRLFAGYNVLLRLLLPRHPPCALKNLTTDIKDARVHYAVLKLRAVPPSHTAYPHNVETVHVCQMSQTRKNPVPLTGPDLSGPNSVPTGAKPSNTQRSNLQAGVLDKTSKDLPHHHRCSIHELSPNNTCVRYEAWTTRTSLTARCSLERR